MARSGRDGEAHLGSDVMAKEGSVVARQVPAQAAPPAEPTSGRLGRLTGRARIASPALQGLLALALYLAVWLIAEAFPLLVHPGQAQLDQQNMDPNFFAWILGWWPYAIGHGLNPYHTALVGAPAGHELLWVTMIGSLALPAAPLTVLAGPVVTFNLLVVASIPVAAWAAFVLCRRLTGQFWPALAGGAVFGFSAYQMNHIIAGQLDLAYSLLLPLMAYLVLVWWQQGISAARLVGLLAVALVLQFYLSIETFAELTAVGLIALAVGYALADRPDRSRVARLSRMAGVAYLIALVCALPFLVTAFSNKPPAGFGQPPARTSVDLAALVTPRPGQTFGLGWLAHVSARGVTALQVAGLDGYVGIPLLLLAVAVAVTAWSRRLTRFLVVMAGLLVILALGPTVHLDGLKAFPLPWFSLWSLPVVKSAYPARFMVFVFLALAVMTAMWLTRPQPRKAAESSGEPATQEPARSSVWSSWRRWALAALAIAAIAANMPALTLQRQPGTPAFVTAGDYKRDLTPGEIIVVISSRGNAGMLWQADTGFSTRLAGGYLGSLLARHTDLPPPIADLGTGPVTPRAIQDFRQYLRTAKVSAILVEASSAGPWPGLLAKAGLHGRLTGGVILYRTGS
jgi:hypothetical protein